MSLFAATPTPPYYAVVFTSLRTAGDHGYADMADKMVELAAQQPGFLGIESAREDGENGLGITVSYWADLVSIRAWKAQLDHRQAQAMGRERWYASYRVRVSLVEREYGLSHH
ncbi:antibiotic biosynthesis monooxygenase family protein [Halomonas cupida]|uniref:antibiotic biosynthesis monooxygenase family protein n=1 Tax=Halomonas TaxID=2745 RepID=UPI001C9951ED|nr:antibiotic biosynthesis monooxygenase [Halomonas sp. DP5Y7-2]MBY5984577.1 antibiotic biosynthesis monooxygenase [Halomonas sp. DP5Y7-2]MEE3214759.1 antibiotic biosynthesis monooxygenase [Pseudomonadota bacterium]